MRAFFLTFEKSPRFNHAADEVMALANGYPAQMVLGYDRAITDTSKLSSVPGALRYKTKTPLGPGDICCYHGHLAVCRQILALNLRWGHVFEDDAFLRRGAALRLAALDEHLETLAPFGIVTLHRDEVGWDPVEVTGNTSLLERCAEKPMLMHGYTISNWMAKAMLANGPQPGNWDPTTREVTMLRELPCWRVLDTVAGLHMEEARESIRTREDYPQASFKSLISKTVVINLDRHTKRMKRMLAVGQKHGLTMERHMAVDGKNLVPTGQNMAEVGCRMSHLGIWRKVEEPVLVLEDDVIFCEKFQEEFTKPRQMPADWDILYIGMSWPELGPVENGFAKVRKCWGNFAYILSENAARKLVSLAESEPNHQADWYPRELMARGELNAYVPVPSLAVAQWAESSVALRVNSAAKRYGSIFQDSLQNHVGGTPEWINTP